MVNIAYESIKSYFVSMGNYVYVFKVLPSGDLSCFSHLVNMNTFENMSEESVKSINNNINLEIYLTENKDLI